MSSGWKTIPASRLLQKSLRRRGFTVEVASNGEEGPAMLETSAYDLLLIDCNMPSCGGMEVTRRLSSKDAHPPAIMVTGYVNEEAAVVLRPRGNNNRHELFLSLFSYFRQCPGHKILEILTAL